MECQGSTIASQESGDTVELFPEEMSLVVGTKQSPVAVTVRDVVLCVPIDGHLYGSCWIDFVALYSRKNNGVLVEWLQRNGQRPRVCDSDGFCHGAEFEFLHVDLWCA